MTYSFKKAYAFSLVAFLAFGQAMASDQKEELSLGGASPASSSSSSSSSSKIDLPEYVMLPVFSQILHRATAGDSRILDLDIVTTGARSATMRGQFLNEPFVTFLESAARQDIKDGTVSSFASVALLKAVLDQTLPGEDRISALTYAHALVVRGSDDYMGMITLLQAVIKLPNQLGLVGAQPHRLPIVQAVLASTPADNPLMPAGVQHLERGKSLLRLSAAVQKKVENSAYDVFLARLLKAPVQTAPAASEPTPSSSSSLPPVSSADPAQTTGE